MEVAAIPVAGAASGNGGGGAVPVAPGVVAAANTTDSPLMDLFDGGDADMFSLMLLHADTIGMAGMAGGDLNVGMVPGASLTSPAPRSARVLKGGRSPGVPMVASTTLLRPSPLVPGTGALSVQASDTASESSSSSPRGSVKRKYTMDTDTSSLPPEEAKRVSRLARNRESARECRRRRKERGEELNSRVRDLEAENATLRQQLLSLKADSGKEEAEEKGKVQQQLRQLIQGGASEEQLKQIIDKYRESFSDYGARRRAAVQFHLDQLERLLLPTQVTRMCMWSLHQDDEFYSDKMETSEIGPSMWGFLKQELRVSDDQARKIKQYRNSVRGLSKELKETLDLLRDLRTRARDKNVALENAMNQLQSILSPSQSARFILWVHNNPLCMQMLNNLWSVLPKTGSGSGSGSGTPAPAPGK